jgi:NADPH-dependent ferric siderophore reductase
MLTVRKVESLTPRMRRIKLGGEAMAGFASAAPDDHVKVLLPPRMRCAARQRLIACSSSAVVTS